MCVTCKDKTNYGKFSFPLRLCLATEAEKENINGKIYTKKSLINAIEEYKNNRIKNGTAFLGMSKYNTEGATVESFYDNDLNFWNSIGIVEDIDIIFGVKVKAAYNYDPELWVVTMVYYAECVDKEKNLYDIIKIKDLYLSRKFQFGISITDGESITKHLMKNKYPRNNAMEFKIDIKYGTEIDVNSFMLAFERFKERIHDVYSMPASVVDENGSRIGLIYHITDDGIIGFMSKEVIYKTDFDLVPIYNIDGNKVISILNFKLVPKNT